MLFYTRGAAGALNVNDRLANATFCNNVNSQDASAGGEFEAKLIAAARSADVMLVVNERSGIGGLSDMAQVRPAPHDRSPADHRRDPQGAAEETGDHALVGASTPTA